MKKMNKFFKKNLKIEGDFPTWTAFLVVLLTDAAQLVGTVGTECGAELAPAAEGPPPGTGMEALLAGMDGAGAAAAAAACTETG